MAGRKQSSFRPATTPLTGDETLDLIQGGKNRRTSLTNLLARAFARANHTGVQAISTVTGLQAELDAKAPSTGIAQSAVTNLVSDLASKATPAQVDAAVAALVDSSPAALDTLNELAAALGDDPNFAATMTTALAGKQATIPSGTYVPINGAGLGGATASDQLLKDWTTGEAFEITAATRDANDLVTTATVKWPDGSAGTFTTVTANTTFLTIDAYTVSHTLSGKTVTQAAVTRNANGAVTVKPALTVA